MNVVVVAPHPDDESIGCGGAIALHRAVGDRVTVLWMTSGEAGPGERPPDLARQVREREAMQAASVLDIDDHEFFRLPDGGLDGEVAKIAQRITEVVERLEPSLVYAPHAQESHPDHVAAYQATRLGIDGSGCAATLCGYEVWTPLSWHDMVLPIDDHLDRKLQAVRCYASQLEELRFDQAVEGLAAYRGAMAGACRYAEVFACG